MPNTRSRHNCNHPVKVTVMRGLERRHNCDMYVLFRSRRNFGVFLFLHNSMIGITIWSPICNFLSKIHSAHKTKDNLYKVLTTIVPPKHSDPCRLMVFFQLSRTKSSCFRVAADLVNFTATQISWFLPPNRTAHVSVIPNSQTMTCRKALTNPARST